MGIPVATITSAAAKAGPWLELPKELELMNVEVHSELNKIPEAKLTLLDGSVAKRKFEVSDLDFFAPGRFIKIALNYVDDDTLINVFLGLVVRHAIETAGEGGSVLRVELKDPTFKLTRQRKSAVFRKQTDDVAIQKLLADAKIDVGQPFAKTTVQHDELIQYYASDWDFIVSRADVSGMVVLVELGALSIQPMKLGAVVRKLDYGLDDTSDLSLEIDGSQQWAAMEGLGWDLPNHELGAPEAASDPAIPVGKLEPSTIASKIATALGGDKYTLFHPATLDAGELKAWADARLARSRLAMLRGHATVMGDATLAPLDTVEILGVGERFNGKALVSAVTHKLDHEGWQTELQLGLPPEWFARQPDIAEVPAAGLLPSITSLQIAKVAPFEADPLGEHRIKLQLPALDDKQGFVWARMAFADAGKDRGFVFWPEAEDEVVVGFLDGDPRQAIVLGALHGKLSLPDQLAPSQTNDMRTLVSRSGIFVRFDDKRKQLTLSTPAGHTVTLDDQGKALSLIDANGNGIIMDDKGITINSASDLTIEASGKIVIKGSAVDVQ
ncbi:phage baseplate assembly protein V [Nannocystaceae bacterium ST9]